MSSNIVSIHVGQAGIQIGHTFWQQLIAEHHLDRRGKPLEDHDDDNGNLDAMFQEASDGHYRPRAVFVDTQPSVADELFSTHCESYLNGNKDIYNKN